ncbi:hypothetical protein [Actinomadura sp. DC4]|uniref:hypothetical protein n=1 Tax=Actinomadura sp. DC4 TaxID=3055069 RepID=UPI0025B07AE7|nr:hypothetical protein [Actinomadura sp. DC4]MDN3359761.1 hypothetical protein [Actinomadura sp. DC4]
MQFTLQAERAPSDSRAHMAGGGSIEFFPRRPIQRKNATRHQRKQTRRLRGAGRAGPFRGDLDVSGLELLGDRGVAERRRQAAGEALAVGEVPRTPPWSSTVTARTWPAETFAAKSL